MEPRRISVEEAARRLGMSRNTVAKYIRQGRLPGDRLGSRYVISDVQVRDYLTGRWTPEQRRNEA